MKLYICLIFTLLLCACNSGGNSDSATQPIISVNSITPNSATIGKTTIFTIQGDHLEGNVSFALASCANIIEIAGGTAAQRQFSCIPTGVAGNHDGTLSIGGSPLPGGKFSISFQSPPMAPSVTSIAPDKAMLGTPSTFTVTGNYLVDGMTFALGNCLDTVEIAGGTAQQRQFRCTPSGSASKQAGSVTFNNSPASGAGSTFNVDYQYPVVQISASSSHTIAIKADGSLWAWGMGALGDGTFDGSVTPKLIGNNFRSATAGYFVTLAIKRDGTLWSWGSNNNTGVLGNGGYEASPAPKLIGTGFQSVAIGGNGSVVGDHALAVKTDGSLWAWGPNYGGGLGDGTETASLVPKQIGSNFQAVAVGSRGHNLAIKTDGTLWGWGYNPEGEIGDGTTNDAKLPKQVGSGFSAISAGTNGSLAVKSDGTLWAWGWNFNNQFGDASTGHLAQTQVGSGFASVTSGEFHTLAFKKDGVLWGWGRNDYGQLGTVTSIGNGIFQIGPDYKAVAASDYYSVALKTDGTLWQWGKEPLWNGDTSNQGFSPKQIIFP